MEKDDLNLQTISYLDQVSIDKGLKSVHSPPNIDGDVISIDQVLKDEEKKSKGSADGSNAGKRKKSITGGILKERISNSARASQKSQHSVDFADQEDKEVQEIFNQDAT